MFLRPSQPVSHIRVHLEFTDEYTYDFICEFTHDFNHALILKDVFDNGIRDIIRNIILYVSYKYCKYLSLRICRTRTSSFFASYMRSVVFFAYALALATALALVSALALDPVQLPLEVTLQFELQL